MRIVEKFYWWNCWNWERSCRETYSAFVPCRGCAVCWPLLRDSYSWSWWELVRFIVGVSGYSNLVFTSLIHREFHFRGSNRRIHCRDNSGSFVPWVNVLLLLFRLYWSSASWPPSRPVRCGGDPRGPPLFQGAFPAVSWSVVEYFVRNMMAHREACLLAACLLLTSFMCRETRLLHKDIRTWMLLTANDSWVFPWTMKSKKPMDLVLV